MRLLICGLGYVGGELARLALQRSWEVWGIRREPGFPPGVRGLPMDLARLTESQQLRESLPAVDALVYLVTPGERTEAAYRRAYIEHFRAVLSCYEERLAAGSSFPKVLFTSSTAVYPENEAGFTDEESPTSASSPSARVLLEAEALTLARPGGLVLRLGGIYGPGRHSLVSRVKSGELSGHTASTHWTNRIHQLDAARAILHLLEFPSEGRLFLGVDEEPVQLHTLVAWLEAQLNLASPSADAPPCIPQGNILEHNQQRSLKEALGSASPQAPTRGRVVQSKRCRPTRLLESGFEFVYPSFLHGYSEILAELGEGTPTPTYP